jgi:tRNA nucleotidyltransferase (CCA-adding enzyme)
MKYLEKGLEVLKLIENKGFKAYIIGGSVRDHLLGQTSHDVDICTNASINVLSEIFPNITLNGSKYLSVTVNYDNYDFEITHFRKDISYINHRHPIVEEVSDIHDDLKRRDFTINAIAMTKEGSFIDMFDGQADMDRELIRAIGEPKIRFEEDALRILRACYFAGKLDFDIEENTLNGMIENRKYLKELSNERLFDLSIKIIYAKYDSGIKYINDNNLFEFCPVYKNLFNIASKAYSLEELFSLYYQKYGDYPIYFPQMYKNLVIGVDEIIKSNFSNYAMYKHQNYFNTAFNVAKILKINANEQVIKFYNLPIKEDSDLALSKYEISQYFKGRNISLAIKDIIKDILDYKIENTKEDILNKIKELVDKYEEVTECLC